MIDCSIKYLWTAVWLARFCHIKKKKRSHLTSGTAQSTPIHLMDWFEQMIELFLWTRGKSKDHCHWNSTRKVSVKGLWRIECALIVRQPCHHKFISADVSKGTPWNSGYIMLHCGAFSVFQRAVNSKGIQSTVSSGSIFPQRPKKQNKTTTTNLKHCFSHRVMACFINTYWNQKLCTNDNGTLTYHFPIKKKCTIL